MNILITGSSGNVGYEIVRGLYEIKTSHQVFAGDYKPENARKILNEFNELQYRTLDFTDPSGFRKALEQIDIVFLLRPPHLADIPRYFIPFIKSMKEAGIQNVVFLSVQGVETQKKIPHYKLETLIKENKLDYVFLRPAYFMQNLTSTLLYEIKNENKIFIPCGKLKLNWVDARDIGLTGACILENFEKFKNRAFEITGTEFFGFEHVARLLSKHTGRKILYESPGLLKFYLKKRKLGIPKAMVFVMIMLHFLPRFGKNMPRLTNTVLEITGKMPVLLEDFIQREKQKF